MRNMMGVVVCVGSCVLVAGLCFANEKSPEDADKGARGIKQWGINEDTTWEYALYEGLMRFHKGQYRETVDYLSQMVQTHKPGPEVHRCIALLRLAFSRMAGPQERVGEWSQAAQKQIELIEKKEQKTNGDYVLLATLKYVDERQVDALVMSKPYLDHLLSPAASSPWADWAYWERTRLASSKIDAIGDELGLLVCEVKKVERTACLLDADGDGELEGAVRARGAAAFLAKHPRSYMGRQMRTELFQWRARRLSTAIEALGHGEWYVSSHEGGDIPVASAQLVELYKATDGFLKAAEAKIPARVVILLNAEGKLDEFLWHGQQTPFGDSIQRYFDGVMEARGKAAVPETVRKWVEALPRTSGPEIHKLEERNKNE
jgi:hypothetical protein